MAQREEFTWDAGDAGSIPGLGRCLGEEHGNPLQYSCLEKSHRQRSLVGYSLWGGKELDTTERLSMHALVWKGLSHHHPLYVYFLNKFRQMNKSEIFCLEGIKKL